MANVSACSPAFIRARHFVPAAEHRHGKLYCANNVCALHGVGDVALTSIDVSRVLNAKHLTPTPISKYPRGQPLMADADFGFCPPENPHIFSSSP